MEAGIDPDSYQPLPFTNQTCEWTYLEGTSFSIWLRIQISCSPASACPLPISAPQPSADSLASRTCTAQGNLQGARTLLQNGVQSLPCLIDRSTGPILGSQSIESAGNTFLFLSRHADLRFQSIHDPVCERWNVEEGLNPRSSIANIAS